MWCRLSKNIASKSKADEIYHRLAFYYLQPGRNYHNLDHISDCLRKFEAVRFLAESPNSIELAIWFHDAIYETWARDNERRSALVAEFFITKLMGLPEALAKQTALEVKDFVIATEHKTLVKFLNDDAKLITDIDLTPLGEEPERFRINSENIRAEFSWVQEDVYRKERILELQSFLKRSRIYSTPIFAKKYEDRARENLTKEIVRLQTA